MTQPQRASLQAGCAHSSRGDCEVELNFSGHKLLFNMATLNSALTIVREVTIQKGLTEDHGHMCRRRRYWGRDAASGQHQFNRLACLDGSLAFFFFYLFDLCVFVCSCVCRCMHMCACIYDGQRIGEALITQLLSTLFLREVLIGLILSKQAGLAGQ